MTRNRLEALIHEVILPHLIVNRIVQFLALLSITSDAREVIFPMIIRKSHEQ